MQLWQQIIITVYGLLALVAFVTSINACYYHKKSFEETHLYGFLFSGFVRADNVVFGLFWFLTSLLCFILQDWTLFLLILSSFWLIRSIGETFYWFLQQFHPREGNPPEKFWYFRIFHNDSVWFVNQIYWQCVTVITLITTIYLSVLWLK
jgi:hypothetical protein